MNIRALCCALLLAAGLGTRAGAADEAGLLAVLRSEAGLQEKAEACRMLARVGTAQAVPVLAALLEDEGLSHMARYALEPIPEPAVDAALRAALGRVDGARLAGVADSLGHRRDAEAVKPLAPLLTHAEPAVAQAAARALGRIGTAAAVQALDAAWAAAPADRREALGDGLLRAAEVRGAAGDRAAAIRAYDRLRADAPSPALRAAAVRGAILARGAEGVPLLRSVLQDEDPVAFAAGLRAGLELPGAAVTTALAEGLGDLPSARRLAVVRLLGRRKDPAATPALEALAGAGEVDLRVAALQSLAQMAAPSSVPAVVGWLGDEDAAVAQAARAALAGWPGPEAGAAVKAMLRGADPKQRLAAVDLAGQRRMRDTLPDLMRLAGDAQPELRAASLRVLSDLAGAAEAPGLIALLRQSADPGPVARPLTLLYARLTEEEKDTTRRALAAAFPEATPAAKLTLLPLLRTMAGPESLAVLRKAAEGEPPEVRAAAQRILCDWPTPDALPELARLAQTGEEETLRILALRGALRLIPARTASGAERAADVQAMLTHAGRVEEQKLALAALGAIPAPESLALVAAFLDQEAVRAEAGQAALGIITKLTPPYSEELLATLRVVAQKAADPKLVEAAGALLK
jgi:HEAT repeat protein